MRLEKLLIYGAFGLAGYALLASIYNQRNPGNPLPSPFPWSARSANAAVPASTSIPQIQAPRLQFQSAGDVLSNLPVPNFDFSSSGG